MRIVFGLTGSSRSCSLRVSFRFHHGTRGNSVEIGDGPAAVTGDERRTVSLTARSGRRGARTSRKSEYLPETRQPPPADQGDGAETRISKGIPGSLYDDPGFFCLDNRHSPDRCGGKHDGHGQRPSEERLPGMSATLARSWGHPVAMSGRLGGGIVCRRHRHHDPAPAPSCPVPVPESEPFIP